MHFPATQANSAFFAALDQDIQDKENVREDSERVQPPQPPRRADFRSCKRPCRHLTGPQNPDCLPALCVL